VGTQGNRRDSGRDNVPKATNDDNQQQLLVIGSVLQSESGLNPSNSDCNTEPMTNNCLLIVVVVALGTLSRAAVAAVTLRAHHPHSKRESRGDDEAPESESFRRALFGPDLLAAPRSY